MRIRGVLARLNCERARCRGYRIIGDAVRDILNLHAIKHGNLDRDMGYIIGRGLVGVDKEHLRLRVIGRV